MGMNIYLFFNGNCEDAMNFYMESTNGSIESLVRFGDTQMPTSEEFKNKIMHCVMYINNTKLMLSDTDGKRKVNFGDNFSIGLDYTDVMEMKTVFNKLSNGGVVTMPLQDTFWGATFGMCTDKFGVNWMFNHDKPKA